MFHKKKVVVLRFVSILFCLLTLVSLVVNWVVVDVSIREGGGFSFFLIS